MSSFLFRFSRVPLFRTLIDISRNEKCIPLFEDPQTPAERRIEIGEGQMSKNASHRQNRAWGGRCGSAAAAVRRVGGKRGSCQGESPSISTSKSASRTWKEPPTPWTWSFHNFGALFLDEKEPSLPSIAKETLFIASNRCQSCSTIAPFRCRHWPAPELKGSRYCAYITPRYIWLRQPSEALRCGGSPEGGTKTITCRNTKSRCDAQTRRCWPTPSP
ncbi:hypothetical protein QBC34DRAFT_73869 [Podospora aff. communis PSN243]|uniref:Uncharacterized protein n=1 Tax=Podospora aff. communis PSN243 TaxID=3040156 RepID=A0AAV9H7I9_9PEZI|nr:hypothetical protein QBC34DRAFT_73869 [Podospora aff. communis PSN243]